MAFAEGLVSILGARLRGVVVSRECSGVFLNSEVLLSLEFLDSPPLEVGVEKEKGPFCESLDVFPADVVLLFEGVFLLL